MGDSTLDTFIEGIDTRFVPLVLALDRAVLGARPDFDTRISYKMLTYALPRACDAQPLGRLSARRRIIP